MLGKTLKFIVNTALFLLILMGALVVFSFVPIPGNYKVFTVESGSMEPHIKTGSLIFVRPAEEYQIGDVITRKTSDPAVTITHRILSKQEVNGQKIFETKGDANTQADGVRFTQEGIIGKELITIPYLGYPVSYAKTPQGLIFLIVIPAVIIIYDEINKIKEVVRKKKQENVSINSEEM